MFQVHTFLARSPSTAISTNAIVEAKNTFRIDADQLSALAEGAKSSLVCVSAEARKGRN